MIIVKLLLDFILQDFHVHAYVYPDHWKIHVDKINEGVVYVISNIYAKEALGSLKPVSSKFFINFSPSTIIERVEEDTMISNHKFEFVDLSDLFSVASAYVNTEFLDYSTGYTLIILNLIVLFNTC